MKNKELQDILAKFPANGEISFRAHQRYGEEPIADVLVDDEIVLSDAIF